MVLNMDFQAKCQRGLRIGKTKVRVPVWLICATLVVAGVLLQFLFVAWRPELRNQELKGHTGLYNSGPLNHGVDFEGPLARDDVYLVVVGLMGLVETYECVKRGLENPVLVALGRRSYSKFQSLVAVFGFSESLMFLIGFRFTFPPSVSLLTVSWDRPVLNSASSSLYRRRQAIPPRGRKIQPRDFRPSLFRCMRASRWAAVRVFLQTRRCSKYLGGEGGI